MTKAWLKAGQGVVCASFLALMAACGGGGGGGGNAPNPMPPEQPMFPPVLDPTGQQLGAFYAVTSSNRFVSFNPGAAAFSTGVMITGIRSGERIVGVEARLADGSVLVLDSSGTVYRLDTASGVATPFIAPFTPDMPSVLEGTRFGLELTAAPEQVRIVSDTGVSIALSPVGDELIQPPTAGSVEVLERLPVGISEIAGTQNLVPCADPSVLYLLNTETDQLQVERIQQGKRVAVLVGPLGVDAEAASGFEIVQNSNRIDAAVAVLRVGGVASLYDIDLVTGRATLQSAIPAMASGESIVGLTAPPVRNPSPRRGDMVAVTASGKLISFDDDLPQALCMPAVPITGMNAGEQIVDIDTRPSNGVVYALTDAARVYTISTAIETFGQASGAVRLQADPLDSTSPFPGQIDRSFNIDFNPRTGSLTAVNRDRVEYTIDVDSGDVITSDIPQIITPFEAPSPFPVTAIAYTVSFAPSPDDLRQTTLIGSALIDEAFTRVDINGANGLRYLANPAPGGQASIMQTMRILPFAAPIGQRIGGGEPVRGLTYLPLARASVFAVSIENRLLQFSPTTPEQLDANLAITGLLEGEQIQSIDLRPLDGELYALSNFARLYTIDAQSGAASLQAVLKAAPGDDNPFTGLDGNTFDIDFSPITRQLRVVSAAGQNLRVDVTTGETITDAPLSNSLNRPSPPSFAGTAYVDVSRVTAGAIPQLLSFDVANDRLVQAIRMDGTTMAVRDLGQLRGPSGRIDVQDVLGFDFDPFALNATAVLSTSTDTALLVTLIDPGRSGDPFVSVGDVLPVPAPFDRVSGLSSLQGPGGLGPLVALLSASSGPQALTSLSRSLGQPGPVQASAPVEITGLSDEDSLVSIDYRARDGLLYGLSRLGLIYQISVTGGVATPVTALEPGVLTGVRFEMDFNPLDDSLIILNDQGGVLLLSFNGNSVSGMQCSSIDYAALAPSAIAYTNNQPNLARSVQLILDPGTASLFAAGSVVASSIKGFGLDEITDGSQSLLGPLDQVSRFRSFTQFAALDVAGTGEGLVLAALQPSDMTQSMLYAVRPGFPSASLNLPGKPIGPPGTPAVRSLTIRIQ